MPFIWHNPNYVLPLQYVKQLNNLIMDAMNLSAKRFFLVAREYGFEVGINYTRDRFIGFFPDKVSSLFGSHIQSVKLSFDYMERLASRFNVLM